MLQTCQSAQVLKCVLQGTSCARMEPVYQDKLRVICANLCQPASSRVFSTSAVQTESLVLMIFQNVQLRKLALIPNKYCAQMAHVLTLAFNVSNHPNLGNFQAADP